jgi:hypothetical protein
MGKKSRSGTGMNILDHFFVRYLSSLMWIRILDPGIFLTLDPGWKKFGSEFRDNKPGSATLKF